MKYFIYLLFIVFTTSLSISQNNVQKVIPYHKIDKWGACTYDGKIVLEPIYDDVNIQYGLLAAFKDDKSFVIDKSGNLILQTKYYRYMLSSSEQISQLIMILLKYI